MSKDWLKEMTTFVADHPVETFIAVLIAVIVFYLIEKSFRMHV